MTDCEDEHTVTDPYPIMFPPKVKPHGKARSNLETKGKEHIIWALVNIIVFTYVSYENILQDTHEGKKLFEGTYTYPKHPW